MKCCNNSGFKFNFQENLKIFWSWMASNQKNWVKSRIKILRKYFRNKLFLIWGSLLLNLLPCCKSSNQTSNGENLQGVQFKNYQRQKGCSSETVSICSYISKAYSHLTSSKPHLDRSSVIFWQFSNGTPCSVKLKWKSWNYCSTTAKINITTIKEEGFKLKLSIQQK